MDREILFHSISRNASLSVMKWAKIDIKNPIALFWKDKQVFLYFWKFEKFKSGQDKYEEMNILHNFKSLKFEYIHQKFR